MVHFKKSYNISYQMLFFSRIFCWWVSLGVLFVCLGWEVLLFICFGGVFACFWWGEKGLSLIIFVRIFWLGF